jgi:hypothetical protein
MTQLLSKTGKSVAALNTKLYGQQNAAHLGTPDELNALRTQVEGNWKTWNDQRNVTTKGVDGLDKTIAELSGSFNKSFVQDFETTLCQRLGKQDGRAVSRT